MAGSIVVDWEDTMVARGDGRGWWWLRAGTAAGGARSGGWRRWWPAEPRWAAAVAGGGVVLGTGSVAVGVAASGGRLLWLGARRGGWMLAARGRLDNGRELEAGCGVYRDGRFFFC